MPPSIGRYLILDRAGDPRLAVFRARDTRLGRTVLVKCVSPAIVGDPQRKARLMEAVDALRSLSHPKIAELCDVVEQNGELWLVFEHVAGESLARVVGGSPLHPRRAAEIAAHPRRSAGCPEVVFGGARDPAPHRPQVWTNLSPKV